MKLFCIKEKIIISICVMIFMASGTTSAAEGDEKSTVQKFDSKTTKEGIKGQERFVSIDFNDVDINVFIKFMSELSGKNYVVDDRVKGKVTIISPTKISEKEAYKVFESVEVNGYSTVEAGEITKIVSSPDARTKNVETYLTDEGAESTDKLVTQLIPLKYADANEVKQLFSTLVSKNSVILAYTQTNMLIVTDIYSNIQRLLRILTAIDVTGIGREITIIPLESADSEKLVKILEAVFKKENPVTRKKSENGRDISFVADERTNTIVLLASEADTLRVKRLIQMLDKDVPKGKEKIHVYYLEYANAEELAKVLQMLPSKQQETGGEAKGKKAAPVVSSATKITADKATNSLILMTDKDDYLTLEEIIKKLDIPRSMVYIECLIMEVNVEKGFELGTEWLAGDDLTIGSKEWAVGGGFGGKGQYNNIQNVIKTAGAATATFPAGYSMGVFGETIKVGNLTFASLGALINAMKSDQDVHILSTPQIITTDNEEAVITVGSNLPYLTKTGTTSSSETYNNYEYKDVGFTLKVTPQISKDGLVRLKIFQEINKLDQAAISQLNTEGTTPVTLKRTIETTVIIKNKNTVAIGGLIDDSITKEESAVPCLGSVPLLGYLFKSISESNQKTNLYFFLTPHVIRGPEDSEEMKNNKKSEIEKMMKEGRIKMYGGSSDDLYSEDGDTKKK
ncbi:MAG: type II secretion system protein GspD [Desulfobacterium sp.]|nr:type II secretion system protein GspD [Desulfobacterium sp.]